MKKYCNKMKWTYLMIASLLIVASCAKMDDYKRFVETGEISYTGKIDSVVVFSGDGRVFVQGIFKSDPKVVMARIYWNNMNDSVDVPVIRTNGLDTLKKAILLPENLYNFRIHTFDAKGNRSVPVYSIGQSYGAAYKESINNRLIISAIAGEGDKVTIVWRDIDKTLGAIATEIEYTDKDDKPQKMRTPIGERQSVLTNFKAKSEFSFKTLYIPDTLCIDTFATQITRQGSSYKIDRSNWTATADTYEKTGQLPKGGSADFVLDGDPDTYWHTQHNNGTTNFPHWLAFDMKKPIKVDMIQLTSRHDYLGSDFKDFLIEGRNSESEEWKVYGSFNLPDIQGPQPFLISGSPTMRYIRVYQLNGGGAPHSHLSEFAVYGSE